MNSTEQTWRQAIAEAARPVLEANGEGAVIVGFGRDGCELVSRFYALADYANDGARLAAVVWARATRWMNADGDGTNYYVVNRYNDGSLIVYNGRHSVLCEA